jgi:uncharacterized protein (TIGR00299 family) protein
MTTLAYFDCPTGIAGDMCLGALVDAGVPLDYLQEQLARLGLSQEYHLWTESVYPSGLRATKVHVDLVQAIDLPPLEAREEKVDYAPSFEHSHHHPTSATRHLSDIEQLITQASLPKRAEAWSLAVFQLLAKAEALAHGIAVEAVHFHEVGATDAIVDIVGTCLGLDWLGIETVYCSALPMGGGTIWAAHGRLPVPVPAVLKLWEMCQVPVYSNGIERELVTPTGAAIATALAQGFGGIPPMRVHKVGLGGGSRQLPIANILRLWIGEAAQGEGNTFANAASHSPHHRHSQTRVSELNLDHPHNHRPDPRPDHRPDPPHSEPPSSSSQPSNCTLSQAGYLEDTVVVLETHVDDLNPQIVGYLYDELFTVGALDVFTGAIAMKKSRPGILITVIASLDTEAACTQVLFRETTTLGIRRQVCQRSILSRSWDLVETPYGSVRVKVARHPRTGTVLNLQPEYEDCAQQSRKSKVPWQQVHHHALLQWYQDHPAGQSSDATSSAKRNSERELQR